MFVYMYNIKFIGLICELFSPDSIFDHQILWTPRFIHTAKTIFYFLSSASNFRNSTWLFLAFARWSIHGILTIIWAKFDLFVFNKLEKTFKRWLSKYISHKYFGINSLTERPSGEYKLRQDQALLVFRIVLISLIV